MLEQQRARRQFETLSWLFLIAILVGVMGPIYLLTPEYPFLVANAVFIVTFFIFTRWLFLLKYSWFARIAWVKLVIMVLSIPLLFYLLDELGSFRAYVDEYGLQTFMQHLEHQEYKSLSTFIRSEMLIFGIGSIITTILIEFRMMISLWRGINRGTV